MRLIIMVNAFTFGPTITALIAAMLQPNDQPAYRAWYRCFRSWGASHMRAVLWVVSKP
jgi:hypothetical protein